MKKDKNTNSENLLKDKKSSDKKSFPKKTKTNKKVKDKKRKERKPNSNASKNFDKKFEHELNFNYTVKQQKKNNDTLRNIALTNVKTDGKNTLKIRFLGGVGEIGKNMTALEYGKDIIVIDAGLIFPSDNMPGVDLVIPDVSYLEQNKNKIRGIIVTHGHEDHIGAIPYILKDMNVPIYGTRLTLTLIENKIKEHNVKECVLNCVKPDSVIKLGCFSIEFINVNHSIAGAVALSITTPVGVVFHSGDFKIDYTPVAGETMNLRRISEIGKKGVLLMMADSTNIEIEGSTMSESVVKDTLDHVFSDNANRRLIIATFASNVHRLQQILDLAEKYKRKVAFSGRSMINIVESACKIGEINIKDGLIVDVEKVKNYRNNEIVIISTGTQGEPMSALTRMASGEFNQVKIGENDTIVISASVIPGNEKMIYGVINNLYRLGAQVIYESLEPIHASGHACRNELRILHSLVKPKFFIPVHGEYRHLKKHTLLAQSLGMRESNTLIADIGDTIEFTSRAMKRGEKIQAGSRFVDGVGIDGTDSFVLRDRIHLSEDGLLVVVVGVEGLSSSLASIEIISKGIVMTEQMTTEAKINVSNALSKIDLKAVGDEAELAGIIRRSLKNYIYKATKKNPMILPVVMVI